MRKILNLVLSFVPRWRRFRLLTKSKWMAKAKGIDLTMHVSKEARIGKNLKVILERGNPITIFIGDGVTIEDNVTFLFRANVGNSPHLYIGANSIIHDRAHLTIGGKLELVEFVEVGIGAVIRATQAVRFDYYSGTGEYASVYDFMHAIAEDLSADYQRTLVCAPVKIGRFVLIAAKATVNPGTSIAEFAIVFPHAVMTGVHDEPFSVYAGVPGKNLNRPDLFPSLDNPFMAAGVAWSHGEPGPAFKTPDEAFGAIPDPTKFVAEEHGFEAAMAKLQKMQEHVEAARDAGGPNGKKSLSTEAAGQS